MALHQRTVVYSTQKWVCTTVNLFPIQRLTKRKKNMSGLSNIKNFGLMSSLLCVFFNCSCGMILDEDLWCWNLASLTTSFIVMAFRLHIKIKLMQWNINKLWSMVVSSSLVSFVLRVLLYYYCSTITCDNTSNWSDSCSCTIWNNSNLETDVMNL